MALPRELHEDPPHRLGGHDQEMRTILPVDPVHIEILGDHIHVESWFDEALTTLRRTGDKWARGMALNDLAALRMIQGQHAQAIQLSNEALVVWQELRERRGSAWAFENVACAAAARGQANRAARLWGASDAICESIGSPLPPSYQQVRDQYLVSVKESLGKVAFQTATAEGRAMSLRQAIQYALAG
jgi:non-specific serine/threonine protein kinase